MPDPLFEDIRLILSDRLDVAAEDVSRHSALIDDLGADSLDLVQLALDVEERFGIEFAERDVLSLRTVEDVLVYVSARRSSAQLPRN